MGIVGREKNVEAEVYNAFYGGQWMKNYPFSIQIPEWKIHGVKYKNYKEHRVLETSWVATL